MACSHCPTNTDTHMSKGYRRMLWAALLANGLMFCVEIVSGIKGGSVSLLADSLDFFGDAVNYGISLWVISKSLSWRAKASLFKAACMALFGVGVLVMAALRASDPGQIPHAPTMGSIGFLALITNVLVAIGLYRFRNGDSNMQSVWLCSRNDAIGNLAVMAAALGVFGLHSAWPDLIVASIMAALALSASYSVYRQAAHEQKHA